MSDVQLKRIAVFSGKGGTGKTTLTASFAHLSPEIVAVDCDVDAANLALLIPGEDGPSRDFFSGVKAVVDPKVCKGCAICIPACRFDAMHMRGRMLVIDALHCEGCTACLYDCPLHAIHTEPNLAGTWRVRKTENGYLVHAELGIAQDNSGKLVAEIRKEADRLAKEAGISWILIDGPPGIGCPVHAAMGEVHRILAIVEPTPSGKHDLVRLLDTADRFQVPVSVAINKYDIAEQMRREIHEVCQSREVEILGEIPFDPAIPHALAAGKLPIDEGLGIAKETQQAIVEIYERLWAITASH